MLTSTDCLITLLYFAVVLGFGFGLRSRVKNGMDFFQAGRTLPGWLCGVAFLATGLGAPEVLGLGAAGARFGFGAAYFFLAGAIPAMLFAGVFTMPLYYGSNARSVAQFVGLRFGAKTRTLSASLFVALTVVSSSVAIYLTARVFQALHIFDGLFHAMGWPSHGIFVFSVAVPALVVLAMIAIGGLRSVIYNQVLQFVVLIAGLLPVVFLGLKKINGWSGLAASLPPSYLHPFSGAAHSKWLVPGIGVGLGVVLGASYWCSDFRVIQIAMAARDMKLARRAPLIGAVLAMAIVLLLVLPGMVAIGLPTPRTTTITRYEGGAIYHETTVARPEAEQGNGLVPARTKAGKIMRDASGQPLLDYAMATPNLLLHVLPNGLLGLGLTALLACFMSGLAANITAFSTVFSCDIYAVHIRKEASDAHYLAVGRWAAAGAVLLSGAAACAAIRLTNPIAALVLVFSAVTVPLFSVVLLGMFWPRATGHGAFAGLIAGASAALLHHGLTLAAGAHRGIEGGWIAVLHVYSGDITQMFGAAMLAFTTSLLAGVVVSLFTRKATLPH